MKTRYLDVVLRSKYLDAKWFIDTSLNECLKQIKYELNVKSIQYSLRSYCQEKSYNDYVDDSVLG